MIELWGTNLLPDRKKILFSSLDDFKVNENNVEYAIIKKAKYQTHPSEFKEFVEKIIEKLYRIDIY